MITIACKEWPASLKSSQGMQSIPERKSQKMLRHYIYYTIPDIISYHTISYHVISHHIISYHIISFHTISYHIIAYHLIECHIVVLCYIVPYYRNIISYQTALCCIKCCGSFAARIFDHCLLHLLAAYDFRAASPAPADARSAKAPRQNCTATCSGLSEPSKTAK